MGSDPERTLSGPEREYIKETYDVMLGTFKEYAEMIIQVGFCFFNHVGPKPATRFLSPSVYVLLRFSPRAYGSARSSVIFSFRLLKLPPPLVRDCPHKRGIHACLLLWPGFNSRLLGLFLSPTPLAAVSHETSSAMRLCLLRLTRFRASWPWSTTTLRSELTRGSSAR